VETRDLFNELSNDLFNDLFNDLSNEERQLADYHYQAALVAAKGLGATRQKVRACREICDHLRQMLQASEAPRNTTRTTH
jgi:hypothetical protein